MLKATFNSLLTRLQLLLSVDNICKQFGPRSGPKEHLFWSGSEPFDTLRVFLKELFFLKFFKFWKKSQQTSTKAWKNYSGCKVYTSNTLTSAIFLPVIINEPVHEILILNISANRLVRAFTAGIYRQGSHKLWKSWKTWKITKKSSMHGKIMEFGKPWMIMEKIMEFCEIIWQNHQ